MGYKVGRLKMHKRWYRVQVEWDPERAGSGSEGGSHGCLRHLQDDIGRTHRSAASSILLLPKGTSYHTQTHTHRPSPYSNVALPGRTHPQLLIGCWTPAVLPLLPSRQDSAWKQSGCAATGHCCSAVQLWTTSLFEETSSSQGKIKHHDNTQRWFNGAWRYVVEVIILPTPHSDQIFTKLMFTVFKPREI